MVAKHKLVADARNARCLRVSTEREPRGERQSGSSGRGAGENGWETAGARYKSEKQGEHGDREQKRESARIIERMRDSHGETK